MHFKVKIVRFICDILWYSNKSGNQETNGNNESDGNSCRAGHDTSTVGQQSDERRHQRLG